MWQERYEKVAPACDERKDDGHFLLERISSENVLFLHIRYKK
jgi:hypothetical protein